MNEMSKQWVVLGAFKLKEWRINSHAENPVQLDHTTCPFYANVKNKTLPEILDIIAEHECLPLHG